MLRLVCDVRNDTSVIRLQGKFLAEWIPEFTACLDTEVRSRRNIELDLSELLFVDIPGIFALKEAVALGAQIGECSAFVKSLLKQILT